VVYGHFKQLAGLTYGNSLNLTRTHDQGHEFTGVTDQSQ
jgi:hypothetical protein